MTSLLLIRHACADHIGGGRVAGREAGLHLNERGRAEADALARALDAAPLAAVYTSPLERARETADPVALRHDLEPRVLEGLTEVDFGDWTGRNFADLETVDAWRHWNTFRSTARVPGGESMTELVCRALEAVSELTERHPDELVAVVSHGDVVRALLLHFLGMSLDHIFRIEVSVASMSLVEVRPDGARVLMVNRTEQGPWPGGEAPW